MFYLDFETIPPTVNNNPVLDPGGVNGSCLYFANADMFTGKWSFQFSQKNTYSYKNNKFFLLTVLSI